MIGSSLKRQPIGPKEGFTLTNVEMYEVFFIFSLIFAVMATMFYLLCYFEESKECLFWRARFLDFYHFGTSIINSETVAPFPYDIVREGLKGF